MASIMIKSVYVDINDEKKLNEVLNQDGIRTVQIIYGNSPYIVGMVTCTETDKGNHIHRMWHLKRELVLDASIIIRDKPVAFFIYNDTDLPEMWKKSYAEAGIPEDKWKASNVDFHPFDEMCESFCIEEHFLRKIFPTKGSPWETLPDFLEVIVKWYRKRAMRNRFVIEALESLE